VGGAGGGSQSPDVAFTWDPTNKSAAINLTNGNLSASTVSDIQARAASTSQISTGKRMFTMAGTFSTDPSWNGDVSFGVALTTFDTSVEDYVGLTADSWGCFFSGTTQHFGDSSQNILSPTLTGGTMKCAVNFDSGKIWFGNDSGWAGDPEAGTGEAWTFTPTTPLLIAYGADSDGVPVVLTMDPTATSGTFAAWNS
jgi:hypothetical protein